MKLFPQTSVHFKSSEPIIKKTLKAIQSRSIKHYTGTSLYFEGTFETEKLKVTLRLQIKTNPKV